MIALTTPPAIVQSYDCQKAATKTEKMICADPELAKLDIEMARVFAEARRRAGGAVPGQQAWLKETRDACTNAPCLKRVYETRILFLKGVGPAVAFTAPGLAGEWDRIGGSEHAPGTLRVTKVSPAAFEFELFAMAGMNMGQIEGSAAIKGADAIYRDPESGCEVRFRRTERRVSVATRDCLSMGGMGVTFEGDYGRGEPPAPSPTLSELEILAPGVTEQAFAALVGKDIELFRSAFSMVGAGEDLDRFGAKVMSGFVRGFPGEREAIVMSRPDGRIYAAVIDGDAVKYFSNDPAFRMKLPETIEGWRQGFADLKVVFASSGR